MKGSSHDVSEMIKGECNVDQVMTKLIVAKDQADVRRGEEHRQEQEREARENEISNQESEYEKSLRADREKMRLEEEEQRFVGLSLRQFLGSFKLSSFWLELNFEN